MYRIQRDIPMPLVTSGVDHGNLRELALKRMEELDLQGRDGNAELTDDRIRFFNHILFSADT